jgi:photosystem II stability/assembly factor-like uncharacterized protein
MGRPVFATVCLVMLFPLWQAAHADWVLTPSGTHRSLYDIQFCSPDTGFASGDSGTLIMTSDGGRTWRGAPSPGADQPLTGVVFTSGRAGVVLDGAGTLFRTETGGESWSRIAFAKPDPINALALDGQGRLLAANFTVGIYKSSDGGKSWTPAVVQGADSMGAVYAFHFPKPDTGFATSTSGVLRTVDGGNTWAQLLSAKSPDHPSGVILTSIFFPTVQEGYLAGPYYSTLARSQDGGHTFAILSRAPANSLFFPNPDTGYAACNGGKIYRSADRGKTWETQFDLGRERVNLRKLAFPARAMGFAVGDSGVILRYQAGPASLRPSRGTRGSHTRTVGPANRPASFDTLGKKAMDGNPGGGTRRLFPFPRD